MRGDNVTGMCVAGVNAAGVPGMRWLRVALVLGLSVMVLPAVLAQKSDAAQPLHRLELRADGGLLAPVGGTSGIMNTGWNVGGSVGYRLSRRLSLRVDGQYGRAGVGDSVLRFELFPSGHYQLWVSTLNLAYTYWKHGRYSGYVSGGGGYSRILTTFSGSATSANCYLLCICPEGCIAATGSGTAIYHYSSNQPAIDGAIGFMRQFRFRSRLFVEARFENLDENSSLAPHKNVEAMPVVVGLEW